jgi:hypothetical protein
LTICARTNRSHSANGCSSVISMASVW